MNIFKSNVIDGLFSRRVFFIQLSLAAKIGIAVCTVALVLFIGLAVYLKNKATSNKNKDNKNSEQNTNGEENVQEETSVTKVQKTQQKPTVKPDIQKPQTQTVQKFDFNAGNNSKTVNFLNKNNKEGNGLGTANTSVFGNRSNSLTFDSGLGKNNKGDATGLASAPTVGNRSNSVTFNSNFNKNSKSDGLKLQNKQESSNGNYNLNSRAGLNAVSPAPTVTNNPGIIGSKDTLNASRTGADNNALDNRRSLFRRDDNELIPNSLNDNRRMRNDLNPGGRNRLNVEDNNVFNPGLNNNRLGFDGRRNIFGTRERLDNDDNNIFNSDLTGRFDFNRGGGGFLNHNRLRIDDNDTETNEIENPQIKRKPIKRKRSRITFGDMPNEKDSLLNTITLTKGRITKDCQQKIDIIQSHLTNPDSSVLLEKDKNSLNSIQGEYVQCQTAAEEAVQDAENKDVNELKAVKQTLSELDKQTKGLKEKLETAEKEIGEYVKSCKKLTKAILKTVKKLSQEYESLSNDYNSLCSIEVTLPQPVIHLKNEINTILGQLKNKIDQFAQDYKAEALKNKNSHQLTLAKSTVDKNGSGSAKKMISDLDGKLKLLKQKVNEETNKLPQAEQEGILRQQITSAINAIDNEFKQHKGELDGFNEDIDNFLKKPNEKQFATKTKTLLQQTGNSIGTAKTNYTPDALGTKNKQQLSNILGNLTDVSNPNSLSNKVEKLGSEILQLKSIIEAAKTKSLTAQEEQQLKQQIATTMVDIDNEIKQQKAAFLGLNADINNFLKDPSGKQLVAQVRTSLQQAEAAIGQAKNSYTTDALSAKGKQYLTTILNKLKDENDQNSPSNKLKKLNDDIAGLKFAIGTEKLKSQPLQQEQLLRQRILNTITSIDNKFKQQKTKLAGIENDFNLLSEQLDKTLASQTKAFSGQIENSIGSAKTNYSLDNLNAKNKQQLTDILDTLTNENIPNGLSGLVKKLEKDVATLKNKIINAKNKGNEPHHEGDEEGAELTKEQKVKKIVKIITDSVNKLHHLQEEFSSAKATKNENYLKEVNCKKLVDEIADVSSSVSKKLNPMVFKHKDTTLLLEGDHVVSDVLAEVSNSNWPVKTGLDTMEKKIKELNQTIEVVKQQLLEKNEKLRKGILTAIENLDNEFKRYNDEDLKCKGGGEYNKYIKAAVVSKYTDFNNSLKSFSKILTKAKSDYTENTLTAKGTKDLEKITFEVNKNNKEGKIYKNLKKLEESYSKLSNAILKAKDEEFKQLPDEQKKGELSKRILGIKEFCKTKCNDFDHTLQQNIDSSSLTGQDFDLLNSIKGDILNCKTLIGGIEDKNILLTKSVTALTNQYNNLSSKTEDGILAKIEKIKNDLKTLLEHVENYGIAELVSAIEDKHAVYSNTNESLKKRIDALDNDENINILTAEEVNKNLLKESADIHKKIADKLTEFYCNYPDDALKQKTKEELAQITEILNDVGDDSISTLLGTLEGKITALENKLNAIKAQQPPKINDDKAKELLVEQILNIIKGLNDKYLKLKETLDQIEEDDNDLLDTEEDEGKLNECEGMVNTIKTEVEKLQKEHTKEVLNIKQFEELNSLKDTIEGPESVGKTIEEAEGKIGALKKVIKTKKGIKENLDELINDIKGLFKGLKDDFEQARNKLSLLQKNKLSTEADKQKIKDAEGAQGKAGIQIQAEEMLCSDDALNAKKSSESGIELLEQMYLDLKSEEPKPNSAKKLVKDFVEKVAKVESAIQLVDQKLKQEKEQQIQEILSTIQDKKDIVSGLTGRLNDIQNSVVKEEFADDENKLFNACEELLTKINGKLNNFEQQNSKEVLEGKSPKQLKDTKKSLEKKEDNNDLTSMCEKLDNDIEDLELLASAIQSLKKHKRRVTKIENGKKVLYLGEFDEENDKFVKGKRVFYESADGDEIKKVEYVQEVYPSGSIKKGRIYIPSNDDKYFVQSGEFFENNNHTKNCTEVGMNRDCKTETTIVKTDQEAHEIELFEEKYKEGMSFYPETLCIKKATVDEHDVPGEPTEIEININDEREICSIVKKDKSLGNGTFEGECITFGNDGKISTRLKGTIKEDDCSLLKGDSVTRVLGEGEKYKYGKKNDNEAPLVEGNEVTKDDYNIDNFLLEGEDGDAFKGIIKDAKERKEKYVDNVAKIGDLIFVLKDSDQKISDINSVDGLPNGKYTMSNSDGTVVYNGDLKSGTIKDGSGTLTVVDGNKIITYDGIWANNVFKKGEILIEKRNSFVDKDSIVKITVEDGKNIQGTKIIDGSDLSAALAGKSVFCEGTFFTKFGKDGLLSSNDVNEIKPVQAKCSVSIDYDKYNLSDVDYIEDRFLQVASVEGDISQGGIGFISDVKVDNKFKKLIPTDEQQVKNDLSRFLEKSPGGNDLVLKDDASKEFKITGEELSEFKVKDCIDSGGYIYGKPDKDGKINSKGIIKIPHPSGSCKYYIGNIRDNKPFGKGVLYEKNGTVKSTGIWAGLENFRGSTQGNGFTFKGTIFNNKRKGLVFSSVDNKFVEVNNASAMTSLNVLYQNALNKF